MNYIFSKSLRHIGQGAFDFFKVWFGLDVNKGLFLFCETQYAFYH